MSTQSKATASSLISAPADNAIDLPFRVAWLLALAFYFIQYALRSAPSVMIPELSEAFGLTALIGS